MNSPCSTPNFGRIVSTALIVAPCFLGCAAPPEPAPPPAQVPMQARSGLVDLRGQLVQGKAEVQKTTKAARDLSGSNSDDLNFRLQRLSEQLATLDKMSTQAREGYDTSTSKATEYFANWDAQLQGMSNSMAQPGQQRRTEAVAQFTKLRDEVTSLRAQFRPYMSSLKEAEAYVQTDKTPQGVAAAKPSIDVALSREPQILTRIDTIVARIDSMGGNQ